MIALLAATQVIGSVVFEPPLVFAGERFSVAPEFPASYFLEASDFANVRLTPIPARSGTALAPAPASFWLTLSRGNGEVVDATEVRVPVALVPRWASWPSESGIRNGVAFLIGSERSIALVPVEDNLGVCILETGIERRVPRLLELDIAARAGPQRPRPLTVDYMYGGMNHVTILSRPAGLSAVSIFITEEFAQVSLSALFDIRGRVRIAGVGEELALRPGEPICIRISWNEL